MNRLIIPGALFASVRTQSEEAYPDEGCGALLGSPAADGWRVVQVVRASNAQTDSAHNRYSIAPVELVAIARAAMRQGLDIAGFYHSHPDHPAQWSPTDFAEAHWLGCAYMITEVSHGRAAVTNAFLLLGDREEDKRFEQLTIEVEP